MAKIIIPTPLRKFTGNQAAILAHGNTIREAIIDLTNQHPDLRNHLLDATGQIRSFVRIFVGDEDILSLEKEETRVAESSIVSIVPAIAGG